MSQIKNYKNALLKGFKNESMTVPENPPKLGEEGKVMVPENPEWKKCLESLRQKNPIGKADEIQSKKDASKQAYSDANRLKHEIESIEKKLLELKKEHDEATMHGYKLHLESSIQDAFTSGNKIGESLMTKVHDHFSGFFVQPEFEHGKTLYELIVAHSPCQKNRDSALIQLALLHLKGKIDSQNRGKEHRRQNLSNPVLGDLYASAITDKSIREYYEMKKAKYLAKRK